LKNGQPDDPIPSATHSRSTSVEGSLPRASQKPSLDSAPSSGPVRIKRERDEDGVPGVDELDGDRTVQDTNEREDREPGWEEQAAAARVLSRARPQTGAAWASGGSVGGGALGALGSGAGRGQG